MGVKLVDEERDATTRSHYDANADRRPLTADENARAFFFSEELFAETYENAFRVRRAEPLTVHRCWFSLFGFFLPPTGNAVRVFRERNRYVVSVFRSDEGSQRAPRGARGAKESAQTRTRVVCFIVYRAPSVYYRELDISRVKR